MPSAGQAPAPEIEVTEPVEAPAEPAAEAVEPQPFNDYATVSHLTRTWVQYGIFGFAIFCIVIGAVEALFGR